MSPIPHLFVNKQDVIQTEKWESLLLANKDAYKNCVVKSITHVKDVHNTWYHEYLQILIEQTSTGARTRIIAERQQAQDQIIIGRWKWAAKSLASLGCISSSSSGNSLGDTASGVDLPLPLYTIYLQDNSLGVLDLANVLAGTTKEHRNYNFASYNCYWFAEASYWAVQKKWKYVEKTWQYSHLRHKLPDLDKIPSLNPMLDLLRRLERGMRQIAARQFEEERSGGMTISAGAPSGFELSLREVYRNAVLLEADDDTAAWQIIENEVNTLVKKNVENEATASKLGDPQKLTEDLHIQEAYDAVTQDSESAKYIEVFDKFGNQKQTEEEPKNQIQDSTEDEESVISQGDLLKAQTVLKVLVGRWLLESEKEANA